MYYQSRLPAREQVNHWFAQPGATGWGTDCAIPSRWGLRIQSISLSHHLSRNHCAARELRGATSTLPIHNCWSGYGYFGACSKVYWKTWRSNCTFSDPYRWPKHLVRILNPSPGPVVIHQNEKVGKLVPLDQPDALCTLDQLSLQQEWQKPKPSDVERAIAKMTDDTQGLHQTEKTKLEALL